MSGIVALILRRRVRNQEKENLWMQTMIRNKRFRDLTNPYEDPHFQNTYRLTPELALAVVRELTPVWRKHPNTSSLPVELKVCDSALKILNVCARYPGATHDSFIWKFSALRRAMINLNDEGSICWLLGDSGYPLEPWHLTPILNAEENTPQSKYTIPHLKSRNSIERCFGVLKSRFRCLLKNIEYEPEKVGCIVNAWVVLHNVCITAGLILPNIVTEDVSAPEESAGDLIRDAPPIYARGLQVRRQLIQRL